MHPITPLSFLLSLLALTTTLTKAQTYDDELGIYERDATDVYDDLYIRDDDVEVLQARAAYDLGFSHGIQARAPPKNAPPKKQAYSMKGECPLGHQQIFDSYSGNIVTHTCLVKLKSGDICKQRIKWGPKEPLS